MLARTPMRAPNGCTRIKAEVRKAVRDFEKLTLQLRLRLTQRDSSNMPGQNLKTNPRISDLEQRDGTMATGAAAKAALGLKGTLYIIWCGVNRLGDSSVKVV